MAVVLNGSQRDPVYQFILFDLSRIGDMEILLMSDEPELARRLRRRLEEDWRLLDQIGWELRGDRKVYAITLPSDEIRTVFKRLHSLATHIINKSIAESADRTLKAAFSVAETSAVVLQELPGGVRPRP
jgi:hypothetical protein